jgi:hypothetical protein
VGWTRSAISIQVESQDGAIMEHKTQDMVEQTIFWEAHKKWYTLAGKAPICNRELFEQFGCTANIPASKAVLDGICKAPADSNEAKKELFAKIASIRRLVPANSVSIVITPEQWKQYWKIVNKQETSSLESGMWEVNLT